MGSLSPSSRKPGTDDSGVTGVVSGRGRALCSKPAVRARLFHVPPPGRHLEPDRRWRTPSGRMRRGPGRPGSARKVGNPVFFFLKKAVGVLTSPLFITFFLALAAVVTWRLRRQKLTVTLVISGFFVAYVSSIPFVSDALL